ncbi:CvpA family protein [Acetobacter conturbans]|nr:CvpA family protein [Acetobacter conturbans]
MSFFSILSDHVPDWASIQRAGGAAVKVVERNPTSIPALTVEGVLILSVLTGLRRGFSREVLGIACWIGAAFIAATYHHNVALRVFSGLDSQELADGLAFGILFLGGLVAGAMASGVFVRLIRMSPLGGMDRLLGAGFGGLRGAVLIVTFYLMSNWAITTGAGASHMEKSGSAGSDITVALSHMASIIARFVPPDLAHDARSRHDLRGPDAPGEAYPENP